MRQGGGNRFGEDDLAGDPEADALTNNGQGPPLITDRCAARPTERRQQQTLWAQEQQGSRRCRQPPPQINNVERPPGRGGSRAVPNNMNDATQSQHFTLRSGSSTQAALQAAAPSHSLASDQSHAAPSPGA